MLGQTLAKRYKLTRILGAGGFGQTYLAIDIQATGAQTTAPQTTEPQTTEPRTVNPNAPQTENSQRQGAAASEPASAEMPPLLAPPLQCVVKQLKPASQDAAFLTIARRLFDTEVKILRQLGDHPQIPRLIDSFEEDNEFYLVQEYIDGQSLEEEIQQVGQFTEAQAIALLEGVLPVLDFIHQHHVVHRDLKPDNLIRRRDNGEMVLIDFGAVKELRTRIITGERTGLTIGIGTQGYTPSEQLSGKPRYSSDLYALGMTTIHALTGRSPTDLPEDLGSLDPCWRGYADVSPGLGILLDKMIRHYIHQRYQSVEAVQHDLSRLEELPLEAANADTYIETAMPQNSPDNGFGNGGQSAILRWRMGKRAKGLTVAIATVASSAFILGLRHIGAFVPTELAIHDRLMRGQAETTPDPRLLIVEVTDADLRSLEISPPSDEAVATVINNLQKHQPARIGLDLLRDQPQEPGHADLLESLKDPNVVAITKLSDADGENFVPPPPGLMFEQISFNNIVEDEDFRVRRALMVDFLDEAILAGATGENLGGDIGNALDNDPVEQPVFSLGVELAIHYLEKYNNIGPADGEILQLGDVRFEPIGPTFGAYRNTDAAGYQMLMRYRDPETVATRVSFTDALNDAIEPDLIQDKIVLIGSTAVSSRDWFLTPFSVGSDRQRKMSGVILHAQVTSQILSAVLNGRRIPWALPDWVEVAWIVALTGVGSVLMVLTQRGGILILFGVSGLSVACLFSILCFQAGGWVPMVAPMSAFFVSAAGARISKSYQRRYWEARQSEATIILPSNVAT